MGKFTLSEGQLNTIVDSLDETGGFLIKRTELKHWIEHYVNNEDNNSYLKFDIYKMPAHATYTDGKCPGSFIEITDDALVCNECHKSIVEVLDDLQNFKDKTLLSDKLMLEFINKRRE